MLEGGGGGLVSLKPLGRGGQREVECRRWGGVGCRCRSYVGSYVGITGDEDTLLKN